MARTGIVLPPQSPPPPPSSGEGEGEGEENDSVDVTGIYPEQAEEISTQSTSGKKWTVGDCTISRGLVEFLFPASGILILLITALVGVFNDPANPIYAQLLFLVAGVLTPNPKLSADTNNQRGDFIDRHYIDHGSSRRWS